MAEISGQGAPTTSTTAAVGDYYTDTDTSARYKCILAYITKENDQDVTYYKWTRISTGLSGGGGTSNYADLTNKPTINGIELLGEKTSSDLKLADETAVIRSDTIIEDANNHITTGYAKTAKDVTQNLPDQVYGTTSEWGVLFFIAEDAVQLTGTQIFYPIDGPYKGRVFTRSLTHMTANPPEPGTWSMLANEAEVNSVKEELITYIQYVAGTITLSWTDGSYISKDDGAVNTEEGSSYSDFVEVTPGIHLVFLNSMVTDNEWNAFYDSTKSFLSSFSNATGIKTIPENAKYMRLSKYTTATLTVIQEIPNPLTHNVTLTQEEYDAITTKDPLTTYYITED